jgi:hypothetical protein
MNSVKTDIVNLNDVETTRIQTVIKTKQLTESNFPIAWVLSAVTAVLSSATERIIVPSKWIELGVPSVVFTSKLRL